MIAIVVNPVVVAVKNNYNVMYGTSSVFPFWIDQAPAIGPIALLITNYVFGKVLKNILNNNKVVFVVNVFNALAINVLEISIIIYL
ncbi:MAG: hypothetical protein ACXWWA_11240 [Chitinophagaceae bacterium]